MRGENMTLFFQHEFLLWPKPIILVSLERGDLTLSLSSVLKNSVRIKYFRFISHRHQDHG